MPLPQLVMLAARVLGPMLAEGGAMLGGRAAAGMATRGAAAVEGKASQQVITKFDAVMNKNPAMAPSSGGPPGGGPPDGNGPNRRQNTDPSGGGQGKFDLSLLGGASKAIQQGTRLVNN